jgi:hypothetical protein
MMTKTSKEFIMILKMMIHSVFKIILNKVLKRAVKIYKKKNKNNK